MKVETFSYNSPDELASNTYVLSDDNNDAVIIDPSVDYDGVLNFLNKNNLKLKAILITHGHCDHIRGINRIVSKLAVPLYIHSLDNSALTNTNENCSHLFNEKITVNYNATLVEDDDVIDCLQEKIRVIHTPFHTIGSVCYYLEKSNILFSGDTLFKHTIGRDDLPTSMPSKKHDSLNKIITLPKETKVYTGHGQSTNIGEEVLFNRFIYR